MDTRMLQVLRRCWRRPLHIVRVLALLAAAGLAPASLAQGLLEHVRGADGEAWLLGSLHFGSSDLYPLGERIERAFTASDRLMVEVNLLDLDPQAVEALIRKHGTYPEGQRLRDVMPEALWQSLATTSSGIGLGPRQLERQRPWLAALSVTTAFLERNGLTPRQGVDRHFMHRARRARVPILELESFPGQIELLRNISAQEQLALLEDTLAQVEAGHSLPSELLAAWRVGDRETLQRLLLEGLSASASGRRLTQRLLNERNGPMAARIAHEVASGGSVFVVVGAAHLMGKHSVTAHLRRRGLNVASH